MPKKQKQKKIELPHTMVFALLREPVRLCRKPAGWLFRKMRHPPILTRLILLNIIALLVFFVGISMFSQYQRGLSEAYRQSLLTQALIISGALGEAATDEEDAKRSSRKKKDDTELIYPNFEPNAAALILRRLITPTRTRARLYDREGNLILDSEYVRGAGSVVSFELEPPKRRKGINLLGWFEKNIMQGFAEQKPSMSNEMAKDGLQFAEVVGAFGGKNQAKDRVNEEGQIIVNVAVPVQRYRAIIGVLMLSTRGGDIDGLVHEQWMALFQIFLIALAMSLIFSFLLALSIARPLRRLARAAASLHSVTERKKRPRLPDLSYRGDEIGELSAALMEMTDALWERVESIEAFAADVAHELKNPL
ncbi:MAG: stimulus-sensing domain-containing protein, partial [Parvibaculales bacterium]